MVDDIEWNPDVSRVASDDEDSVFAAWVAVLLSGFGALKLVKLSESEAAAWLFCVASTEVAVNVAAATVGS